ncbi:MAG: hypothetical protein IPK82_20045 [Polyangiaceae bacterium]|nr:hypothetical protein [Polyangiaceae bacterium]
MNATQVYAFRRPGTFALVALLVTSACELPVRPGADHDGEGGSGGSTTDTSEAGNAPVCAGACREWKPAWFDEVSMFWIGPPDQAPPCPDFAPIAGSEGYADLTVEETVCPACVCSPAGCSLPEIMSVSAGKCVDGEPPSIDWVSPAWEGACTNQGAIEPGISCNGEPCAQSLTIGPTTVETCQGSAQGTAQFPELSWGKIAKECLIGPLDGDGCSTGQACVPNIPEGFSLCVYRFGDDAAFDCPETYPERHVVYAGVNDTRGCEPCTCGEPMGAACSAVVEVHTNSTCDALVAAATVSVTDSACVDLPSNGPSLGSKSAAWVEQIAGTCTQGGGQAIGTVLPAGPVTLCCDDDLSIPK